MSVKGLKPSENLAGSVLESYQRELFAFLMRRLRNSEDVRDLAQEVYLRLLRVEKPAEILKPLAYVYRTAGNAVAEFRMRQRRDRDYVQFDSQAASDRSENPAEAARDGLAESLSSEYALKRVLEQLPALYRTILLRRVCDGTGYREIARELELSVHTVEKYYFRAMALLRTADWD